jgi:CRISPR-associated protein Csm1
VALFSEDAVFSWKRFIDNLLGEKYQTVYEFFKSSDFIGSNQEYGKAFIYKLLSLIREANKPISKARWVYFLSRMEPKKGRDEEKELYESRLEKFQNFANWLEQWFRTGKDRLELESALQLYVYTIREKEKHE